MARALPFFSAVLSAALINGCVVPQGVGPAGPGTETVLSSQRGGQLLPGRPGEGGNLIGHAGGNLIGHAGGNIIAAGGGNVVARAEAGLTVREGASLSGVVKAPAGIIAAGGGNLIGHAGGNIIATGGGNFRVLAAIAQQPVASRPVFLMDASGRVVTGDDGKPLTAITDAEGRFAFRGFANAHHLVVALELEEGRSVVQAVLPQGDAGAREVELDLVSSLTTAYIRDRYVSGQADPAATLDKLPAAVEKETRDKAGAALAAAGLEAPATLAAEAVVALVDQLRQKDAAFHAQMETVKQLLIAAGQSDLGSGRPGTEVTLNRVGGLALGPDGQLYIAASGDHRVWRLDAAGRLATVAGNGGANADPRARHGTLAKEASFDWPSGLSVDDQGRLLVVEDLAFYGGPRLSRIGTEGKVAAFTGEMGSLLALPASGDDVWVYRRQADGATLGTLRADGRFEARMAIAPGDVDAFFDVQRVGKDAQGRLYLGSGDLGVPMGQEVGGIRQAPLTVYRVDPAARTVQALRAVGTDGVVGVTVDPAGNVLTLHGDRRLKRLKPDGQEEVLATQVPEAVTLHLEGAAIAPDGTAYLAQRAGLVYRLRGGALEVVAGTGGATGGAAEDLAFKEPAGLAAVGDDLVVADQGHHRLLRIKQDRSVSVVAGTGVDGFAGDGGPATQAKLSRPRVVRADQRGHLYVLDQEGYGTYRLRQIDAQGTIRTIHESSWMVSDFVAAPDGTVYLADWNNPDFMVTHVEIKRIAPDGTVSTLVEKGAGFGSQFQLALAADAKTLYILGNGVVHTWQEGAGLVKEAVKNSALFASDGIGFTVDGQGRFYGAGRKENQVVRFSADTGTFTPVAGPDGTRFSGTGVDDSLLKPRYLTFDAKGNLFISDTGHKQVKRVPAESL